MAKPSPLNWNQRNASASSPSFQYAEDEARYKAALNGGPTGYHAHQQDVYQTGPHKGKTKSQLEAEYTAQSGLPSKITQSSAPKASAPTASPSPTNSTSFVPSTRLPGLNAPSSLQPTIQNPVNPSSNPAPSTVKALDPRKPATFDGSSAAQFGQQAAARQGVGNAFTGYKTPTSSPAAAPSPVGPAQQRLDAFNAANPNVKTEQQIYDERLKIQNTRDALALSDAQKKQGNTTTVAPQQTTPSPKAPLNGMQVMTPEVARAALAADKAQNPVAPAPSPSPSMARLAPIPSGEGKPFASSAQVAGQNGVPVAAAPAAPKPQTPLSAVKPYAQTIPRPSTQMSPPLIAGARAAGGPVQGGQPYLVGEKGPEIIVPQQNGTVIPNRAIHPRSQRPMALSPSHNWRTPSKPARAAHPSLVASRQA